MPSTYEWAVLRAVPRVDRSEFVNVGVVVYCQARGFLEARVARTSDGSSPSTRRSTWTESAVIWRAYVRCAPVSSPPVRRATLTR